MLDLVDEGFWKLYMLCLMAQENIMKKLQESCALPNGTSFDGHLEQLELTHTADRSVHTLLLGPSHSIPRYWPNKNAHICAPKYMYKNTYSSIIDSSQK